MSLAENVRRLRKREGLSQAELADLIGSSFPRISEIERGVANPTLDTLERLANALNTTVDKLVKLSPSAR